MFARILLLTSLALVSPRVEAFDDAQCAERVAKRLLTAILDRDGRAIRRMANNPDVFDEDAVSYLTGDASVRFTRRGDLKSAYALLVGQDVLTKVSLTEGAGAGKFLEVVYLPRQTAPDFYSLAILIAAGKAKLFRDYVMCRFDVSSNRISMPHACYAETDVFE